MSSFLRTGRTIIGIGLNYRDHAKEMGSKLPSLPIVFLKPTSSYLPSPGTIRIPPSENVHHEVELGVVVGNEAKQVSKENAMSCVAGYALALDMTARNAQQEAKKLGRPWTVAKGQDTFTPISDFLPKEKIMDPHNLRIWCEVNKKIRQDGSTSDMIFKIPELIAYVSSFMTLREGDLILTGTPSGVGPVVHGDKISCSLEQQGRLLSHITFDVSNRST